MRVPLRRGGGGRSGDGQRHCASAAAHAPVGGHDDTHPVEGVGGVLDGHAVQGDLAHDQEHQQGEQCVQQLVLEANLAARVGVRCAEAGHVCLSARARTGPLARCTSGRYAMKGSRVSRMRVTEGGGGRACAGAGRRPAAAVCWHALAELRSGNCTSTTQRSARRQSQASRMQARLVTVAVRGRCRKCAVWRRAAVMPRRRRRRSVKGGGV